MPERLTNRQTDRQTDRETDRKSDRNADGETDMIQLKWKRSYCASLTFPKIVISLATTVTKVWPKRHYTPLSKKERESVRIVLRLRIALLFFFWFMFFFCLVAEVSSASQMGVHSGLKLYEIDAFLSWTKVFSRELRSEKVSERANE